MAKIGSRSNYFTLEAVRIACKEVWHRNSSLHGARPARDNLSRADLRGTRNDSGTNWLDRFDYKRVEAVGPHADLRGADFGGVDLHDADLRRADLSNADLSCANLTGANLSRADLIGANLIGADLSRANLFRADLSRADLRGATLSGINLSATNLSEADLSGADLSGADLTGADVSGAKLHKATLHGVNLCVISYDDTTTWPEGFDPVAAGAGMLDEPGTGWLAPCSGCS